MSDDAAVESGAVGLVLSDVDGTLLTHEKVLSERSIAAVGRLREAGVLFAIVSGRPPRGVSMLKEALQMATPLAGFNGGGIVEPGGSTLSNHHLAADDAKTVIRIVREHGLDVWLYTDTDWLVADTPAAHVAKEQGAVGFAPVETADFAPHLEGAVKIVGISDDPALVAVCEEGIRTWAGDRVSAQRSQSYSLDVTHPQATKGHVLAVLFAMYGVPANRIATVGDGPNDVLMFEQSGFSIAMGNADPEVQRAAMHVTGSSDDEGIATAMERWVLPPVGGDRT